MQQTTEDFANGKDFGDCLMDIIPFLVWSVDADEVQGGVKAKDALESFRHILGWDEERFEQMCELFRG